MLRFSLEITMVTLLMAASYVVHWVAHVIVTEYGLLGGVIACGEGIGQFFPSCFRVHRGSPVERNAPDAASPLNCC